MLRKLMTSLLSIVLLVALGLPLTLWVFQDKLIFMPQPAPDAPPRADGTLITEVHIPVGDGLSLRGWLARPQGAVGRTPLAIYFGGNAEEASGMATLAGLFPGWALLVVNYRGYGGNAGAPSEKALVADALAIYDWAAKREDTNAARIALIGRSLGSGVAVQLAAKRNVRALALLAPFDSLRAVAQRHYPLVPMGLLLRHPFDSLALAPDMAAPLLVVAAARDSIIPPEHARRLFDAWRAPKAWLAIPGADHNDLDADPACWDSVAAFLAERMR